MPSALSITKLQEFLTAQGLIIFRYYVMDGMCFFLEVQSIKTADVFMLYLPSKYNFSVEHGKDVYKIKYIDIGTSSRNVTQDYAHEPDNLDVEDIYRNDDDNGAEAGDGKNDNMEDRMEGKYKHDVRLKDISKDDLAVLKSIYRQIRRLRYCVQNLKYKVAIVYKNYICAIRRDDSINLIVVKHMTGDSCKKLMVIADLETLSRKDERSVEEIRTVRNSIYRILERNQGTHARTIFRMIESQKDIVAIPEQAQRKKDNYDRMLDHLSVLLETVNEVEHKLESDLEALNADTVMSGLQTDITRAHHKAKLEKDMDRIMIIKDDICKTLIAVRAKRESAALSIDTIMFDNTVMFDTMIKNFASLQSYC